MNCFKCKGELKEKEVNYMVQVAAALIWDKGKFMICQRPENKARGLLWEFVGGKVEKGETKEQTLIRECKEELNISLKDSDNFMEFLHKIAKDKAALSNQ